MVRAIAAILTLASSAAAQSPEAAVRAAVAQQFAPADDAPGVAAGIVPHDGGRPYCVGFGRADLAAQAAIAPTTRFELASVGKMLTAIAVLKSCEDGKLAAADDIRKHLPELPAGGPTVRIADLLRHTSGLPDYTAFADVPRADPQFLTNLDFLPEFARQRVAHPATAAGRKFAYNNTNYMLLAVVVARAATPRSRRT